MVSTVFNGEFRDTPRPNPLHAFRSAWQGLLQRRSDRLALERAGRLGPRLLADMGLGPEQVRPGGWEDLRPNGLLVKRRR